jgi:orotidine-5'-phosphate decarboxylase
MSKGSGRGAVVPFGARVAAAMDRFGPVCVGIDPHPGLLAAWGLDDDVAGLRRFALTVVEALVGQVAALKPQAAFFERHGARGVAVLEEVLAAVRGEATQVICDAKRGDGAPLACDALTVSPYLGVGSLAPAFAAAEATGRGLFVLALTSNPEGASVQHAHDADGRAVAAGVARQVAAANARALEATPAPLGSFGLVVGATVGDAARRLDVDLAAVRGPLLAPGVGAQGAGAAELADVFGAARSQVLASTSRAVLDAGPTLSSLRDAAARAVDEASRALR